MKKIILLLLIMMGTKSFSQIKFEKGYFISNKDIKTECLIKNENWNSDDSSLTYKISISDNEANIPLKEVKEFSVYNKSKYLRQKVNVDTNITNDLNNLSNDRSIKNEYVSLLLKVLLEGEVSLLVSKEKKYTRYFYMDIKNNTPKELIYKKYIDGDIVKNFNNYKQELLNNVLCNKMNHSTIEKLSYNEGSLLRYFKKYNDCENESYKTFNEFSNKKRFFFKLKAGASFASMNIDRVGFEVTDFSYQMDFGSKIIPTIGFEVEYFLPSKGNKWSIYSDPKYKSFSSKTNTQTTFNGRTEDINVTYNSIEIPLNIRYYVYLSNDNAISFNLGLFYANNLNSSVDFEISSNPGFDTLLEVNTSYTPIFGIAFHKGKYSLELEYSNRNFLYSSGSFTSRFPNLDFSLSYSLF
tara:strand:+ start:1999 stop:3228 length:1230 start_codon:yes stop_codon:yes gene_type:complete